MKIARQNAIMMDSNNGFDRRKAQHFVPQLEPLQSSNLVMAERLQNAC